MKNIEPKDVLTFWFEEVDSSQWYKKDPNFDSLIETRFGKVIESALDGELLKWEQNDDGRLALIIILDQFCRNIFRDTPKAFAGDARALRIAQDAIQNDALDKPHPHLSYNQFFLMPLMHSESISVQDMSLPLFKVFTHEMTYKYAVKHRDIIAQFGRYPHRNKILKRTSSEAESEFLKQPGSSF